MTPPQSSTGSHPTPGAGGWGLCVYFVGFTMSQVPVHDITHLLNGMALQPYYTSNLP